MTARACANLRFFVSLLQRLSPHGWLDMMFCVVLRSAVLVSQQVLAVNAEVRAAIDVRAQATKRPPSRRLRRCAEAEH